jgi:2-keto-3-deoxy-L-rhamnonate aldolase RhmA
VPHFAYRSLPAVESARILNAAGTVIALIETADGIARADEIAAVDGIDILSIGTNDLCADLGIAGDLGNAQVDRAYATVIEACRKHGKRCGIGGLASRSEQMARYVEAGARYISLNSDLGLLMSAAGESAKKARAFLRQGVR